MDVGTVDEGDSVIPQPKPEPRAKTQARARRHADAIARACRNTVAKRDGRCRLSTIHECRGHATWAHFAGHRRFQTRGMPPEERHQPMWSLMLCADAHRAYDARELRLTPITDRACDGPLLAEWGKARAVVYPRDRGDVEL